MSKKITFIDVLIAAIVIAAIFIVLSVFRGGSAADTKTVTYTVLVTNQIPEIAEKITAADNVLLDAEENAYGKVLGAEISPAKDSYFDSRGERYVVRTIEELMDVVITVQAEATVHESGYKIGKQDIKVGEAQNISAGAYSVSGYITEVAD